MSDIPFKKERDTNRLSMSMTNVFMQGAPKKKICTSTMYEHIRTACFMTMANIYLANIEIMKQGIEKGYSMEEIMGYFHIEMKETWDILARSKMGTSCFNRLDIETIVNASGPSEILKKAVVK